MKTSGEFLIFLLLLITNGRVFFVEQRKDSIVMLAPLAFFLSIFQLCAWGFDVFTGLGFALALLVLLSNFHALYRYFERLYVDHYSPLMYIWAISTTLVSIACILFLVYFAPSTPLTHRQIIQKTPDIKVITERYTGSFRTGFEKSTSTQKPNITLYRIASTKEQTEPQPVLVFFPDKRAETYHYIPYLLQLAEQGYTIISSDINTKDCRWLHNFFDGRIYRRFGMIMASLHDNFNFNSQTEFYTYNYSLECKAVFDILNKKIQSGENNFMLTPDTKFILASDFMANTAIKDYKKENPEKISALFYMNELDSSIYKTPGYGFVAYTDPLLARALEVERDKTGEEPKLAALKTAEALKALYTLETATEEKPLEGETL